MIGQRFISPPFPTSLSLKDKDPWELMGMCAMEERWEEKSQTARRRSALPPSRSLLGWTLGHWSGGVGWGGVEWEAGYKVIFWMSLGDSRAEESFFLSAS